MMAITVQVNLLKSNSGGLLDEQKAELGLHVGL